MSALNVKSAAIRKLQKIK
jgi:hypothetical protein